MKTKNKLLVGFIILGFLLRIYNLNWDSGQHLHPDERAIVLYTLPLQIPQSINSFFSSESSLNPHFFAYGSFPLYLLRFVGFMGSLIDIRFGQYEGINLLGRFLSALFDITTAIIIYKIARYIFSGRAALFTLVFYICSVLPIQLSHFYAVDTLLTFFLTLVMYYAIRFYQEPSRKTAVFIGITLGFALATKISGFLIVISIFSSLAIDFLFIFLKSPHKPHLWLPHLRGITKKLAIDGTIILIVTFITFTLIEPYAILSFSEFYMQTLQQSVMTKNAFTFPYTLQYVGKIPYIYELKQIFLWGLGPFMGIIAYIGIIVAVYRNIKLLVPKEIILLSFFFTYFIIVGSFAIGFMRYMLPLYPIFAIFAGSFLDRTLFPFLQKKIPHRFFSYSISLFGLFLFLWPLTFLSIYTKENTRIIASRWIYNNVDKNKVLAVEHWDDQLPLPGPFVYKTYTLPLYDPDTSQKWKFITTVLKEADYIILASNRLYTPLQKLADCKKLFPYSCYPQTAQYYQQLFSQQLGYVKVAEFNSYPTIPILNIPIDDQSADESFTVYDHPKVLIYKKL